MSTIPVIGDHPQVVMNVPSQKEINDAAEVKMTYVDQPNGVKPVAAVTTVIDPSVVLADTKIVRLSKRMKLRMVFAGIKEILQSWKTAPTYEEVTSGSSTVWMYVDKDKRTLLPIATSDDGIVITDNGTFSEVTKSADDELVNKASTVKCIVYNLDSSSSSALDGMNGPDYPAIAADAATGVILDMPGKTGGSAMTSENYLSLPGTNVVTSQTAAGAFDIVAQMYDSNSSSLTTAMLLAAGVPANTIVTSNLAAYKSAIGALTEAIADIEQLNQIIVTANAEA